MFATFLAYFAITNEIKNTSVLEITRKEIDNDFRKCIDILGGKTFNEGVYRVFRNDQVHAATLAIERAFPEYVGRILAFGYDWLGRHFVVDFKRTEKSKPLILMIEPGSGEAFEIPVSIVDFHNVELVEYAADALAMKAFSMWMEKTKQPIEPDKCVGYQVPLFLGGQDTIDNMECIDLEVYIEICGQLRNKTLHLNTDQKIGEIKIQ